MPPDHSQPLLIWWHLAVWDTSYMNFPVVCHTRTRTPVYCSSGEKTMKVKLAPKPEHRWVHISVSSNPGARHLVFNVPHLFIMVANRKLAFISISQPRLGDVADEVEDDKGKIISRSHSSSHNDGQLRPKMHLSYSLHFLLLFTFLFC